MPKALITSVPFADRDRRPLETLESAGVEYVINPIGRKLTEPELATLIPDIDVLIAGTEPITDAVFARANRLRMVSRIGIGLDSVDLLAARRRGIHVSYTPDAPAPAVAELAVGLMLSLLRMVHVSNREMHDGRWHRYFGRRLALSTVGIIGAGRIGSRVIRHLAGFAPPRILVNDVAPRSACDVPASCEWVTKETIYEEADVVSVHVPLTPQTRGMMTREQLLRMKPDACLVNTARGGIVSEPDLAEVLALGHLSGAAIDVFEREPYRGPLSAIDRCLLTSHMGSMSVDCRARMELEATEEAVRFLSGEPLVGAVPELEYDIQQAIR